MAVFKNTFLALIFAVGSAFSQSVVFRHLGVDDGLSQSTVTAIVQDKEGYIWVGTANGLNRYDGYSFKVFRNVVGDSSSLGNNGISALMIDRNGNLWVGNVNGILNEFNPKTESFTRYKLADDTTLTYQKNKYYDYPLSISRNNNNTITSLSQDSSGIIWVGTWGRGLIKFNEKNGKFKFYTHDPKDPLSINFNRITKILTDKSGVIWVGTFGGGLNKIITSLPFPSNGGEDVLFFNYHHDPADANSLSDNKILSLYEDKNRALWIGTYSGGLDRFDFDRRFITGKAPVFVHYKSNPAVRYSLANNTVLSILQSRDGFLWVGTFGGGLNKLDLHTSKFVRYLHNENNPNSLGDNDVLSLFEDNSGIIWIGAHLGKGLSLLIRKKEKLANLPLLYKDGKGLNDNVVWAVFKDWDGNLWVGTYRGGLNEQVRKTGKWKYFNPSTNGFVNDFHVRSITQDYRGGLWVGTYSGGLNYLNLRTGKFLHFRHSEKNKNSLPANQIQALLVDGKTLWIGAFGGGVCKLNLGKFYKTGKAVFEKFGFSKNNPEGLSDDRVYSLFKDSQGNLWVGTYGGGVNILPAGERKFSPLGRKISAKLSDNRVTCFAEQNGKIFIGTNGGGLEIFDTGSNTLSRFTAAEGSAPEVVYGILFNDSGNLWMSTDNGLYKIEIDKRKIKRFDISDGFHSRQFNDGAYLKRADGTLYFGGINGVNYFKPESLSVSNYEPNVVITSIKIFDKRLNGERKYLRLKSNQNFFSFEFSALDFTNPRKNRYAYILQGLEKNWNFTDGNFRKANYTNLSPGKYIFKVRGTNSDGVWSRKTATVKLEILPPFYARWEFILLVVLLLAGLIGYIVTIRLRQYLAIQRLKTKLAADLHDNVGAGLTEISILSELSAREVEKSLPATADRLKDISGRARELVDSMSDIVWVVNPARDRLYDLILRLKTSNSEVFTSKNIKFNLSLPEKLKQLTLPMHVKQNLFLILKEAINNSVKHSNCRKINLSVKTEGKYLKIELSDDGRGFDSKEKFTGNGLVNMRKRAEEINGKIQIVSTPAEGTKIYLSIKL